MPSERIQRQIDSLLDEAEEAAGLLQRALLNGWVDPRGGVPRSCLELPNASEAFRRSQEDYAGLVRRLRSQY